jgi:two-component system, chemotaxis family, CheB/CheR fusion protein
LLQEYAPAAVVIRRNYEALYFHGPTHLYLRQPAGTPTADLTALAREGLRERIHAAVHKAVRENRRVSIPGARVKRNGRAAGVRISARLLHGAALEGLVLVSFEDEAIAPAAARGRTRTDKHEAAVARQLEHELRSTRAALQGTVEELTASNEEIMSMNEELQSANEELETSKEELQSLNEELSTVNAQLQEKVGELERANDDLSNLLASTDTATLFLGRDRTIRRFTAAATRLFKLIASDVGRPLDDVGWRFSDPDMNTDIEAVLQSLATRAREVRLENGPWYLRRITPYRTADHRIEGVVVTFADISAQKETERVLQGLNVDLEAHVAARAADLAAERNFMAAVLDTAAALVFVFDRDGRVVRWNKTCEQASGLSAAEVLGQPVIDRVLLAEEADAVNRVFAELRAGRYPQLHQNHWRHADGSQRLIAWSSTCLRDARGEVEYIIGTGIDISAQQRSEIEARERQAELAHLHRVYTAGEFAAVMAHELSQPLAAIASYSEAGLQNLRRGQIEAEELTRDLEQIGLQAQRAGRSIRELRRFLSKEEHTREYVDLNEVIRAAKSLLAPEARAHGVRLEWALSDTPLPAKVAPIQIEHVLVNLVHNAIEAIRSAGTADGTITIGTRSADGQACVTVQDNGPGFAEAQQARLFERFYTTKPQGLGIGSPSAAA